MKKFTMQNAYLLFALILGVFITLPGCGGSGGSGSEGGGGEWDKALVSLTVTPATVSIPVTGTQQFSAFAKYSDGSSREVTASSTWTSGTTGVTFGLVKGFATGVTANVVPVVITAAFGGMSSKAKLTVTNATSTKFEVKPTAFSIPVTGTQQYTAIETFSDGTSQDRTSASTWTSPDLVPVGLAGVATITNSLDGGATGGGVATGVHPGTSTITASYGVYTGVTAKTAILTVTDATSTKFEVLPSGVEIPVTGTQQYMAIETFSDGTSQDRTSASTWTSPDLVPDGVAGVATITNSADGGLDGLGGKATGENPGTSTITADYGAYTGTAILTVVAGPPPPTPLAIDLGSAASYGIASQEGMTSTGVVVVNGDVALYPLGTCSDATGTPADCLVESKPPSALGLTVNGVIRFPTDSDAGATALAVTNDLNAAWVAGLAETNTQGTIAADELSGKTFLPGVYTNANLNMAAGGIAIIDAQGDANAIFIFQVEGGGDLIDSGTLLLPSEIRLRNGAQAKNVWFVVGRDITIGSGTTWNGNILAGRTATVLDGSSVMGRVLAGATGAGAFTITGAVDSVTSITVPE